MLRRIAIIAVAAAAVATAVIFVRIDNVPSLSTYGLSAGANSSYCSADVVHGHLELSCQHAQ